MKYCLIGEKLPHSYSEIIHRYMGLDYSLKELAEKEIEGFVKSREYDGFNITIPYKKTICEHVLIVDKNADEMGAVNTVRLRPDGAYEGINTDFGGLKYTIERMGFDPNGKTAVILGTGGAASCAEYVLKSMGAKSVNFVSRSGKYNYESYFKYKKFKDAQFLINASPVGSFPKVEEPKVDLKYFPNLEGVLDMVYNPSRTELLYRAQKLGLKVSNGLPMLIEQGLLAEDFWLNRKHNYQQTEELINYINVKMNNIVLSGMPSCGKSTIGKQVALLTGKTFVDLDDFIQSITGKSPSEIILESGEGVFREIEHGAAREIGKRSNQVIALGGGTLSGYSNAKYLTINGKIIYIRRPLQLLSSENRPLSQKEGIENLYLKRKSTYERTADGIVENDGTKTIDEVAKEIVNAYEIACNKRS